MSLIAHNIAVFAIAALLMSFAWVWGGTRGDLLPHFVPWITLILVEVTMAFPQRAPYESLSGARLRVWRAVRSDKLTWACVAFLMLLAVPFVNTSLKVFPWCPDRLSHFNVFLWFFPTLLAMIAAKHALRRHGKRMLVSVLVWNGVALAALGFIQLYTGANSPFWTDHRPGLVFFSTFGYPNMAGDYFASLTFLAIGLWRRRLHELGNVDCSRFSSNKLFWSRHYPLIAVVVLYFSALNTLSRSAILLATIGTAFLFVMAGMLRMKQLNRAGRVKFGAALIFSIIGISLFAMLFTPDSVRKELNTLDATGMLNRMTSKTEYHTKVATELFWDYPVFGCGGWGYSYLSPEKIPEIAKRAAKYGWGLGSANVHNDYMQFLCEHGLVGSGLLLLIIVLAVVPVAKRWRSMAMAARFSKHTGLPWPKGFFCFPPAGVAIYVSALATLIHAFYDCPLRSPAVLSLFFVELVLVDGFLPRVDEMN